MLQAQPGRSQEGSVLDLVEECDILAAHPDDPERYADGVADDEIVPKLAIMACEAALEEAPEEPRFRFQLGRALLAVGKKAEAFTHFQQASADDYAAAWAYLGDTYQYGLGVDANTQKAFDAYKKSVALGFQIASTQIDQLQFNASMYTGEFLSLFYSGDFDSITRKSNDQGIRSITRNYVFNLVLKLTEECQAVLRPSHVPTFYLYRYPGWWTLAADEDVTVAIQTSIGEYDAQAFVRRHGCDGAVAKYVFAQMDKFFSQAR